jgi:hypothetical protein
MRTDPRRNGGEEDFNKMSRSSFASFHLTGIKPSSGKMITSSVDRLFESDAEVFMSNNFTDFQVIIHHSDMKFFFLMNNFVVFFTETVGLYRRNYISSFSITGNLK